MRLKSTQGRGVDPNDLADALLRHLDRAGDGLLIIEATTDPPTRTASDLRIISANAAMCALLGRSEKSLTAMAPAELLAPGARYAAARIHGAMLAGSERAIDVSILAPGSEQPARLRVRSFALASKPSAPSRWALVARGKVEPASAPETAEAATAMPEASAARSHLLRAFESLPGGVAVYDSDDRMVLCNSEFRRTFAAVADHLVAGAMFVDQARALAQSGALASATGDPEGWVVQRLDGHARCAGASDAQLADGRWVRFADRRTDDGGRLWIVSDASELRRKEAALQARVVEMQHIQDMMQVQSDRLSETAEELSQARNEAERANRTKSHFLANMSHELRSPLNAIIGFSEIMKAELFGELGSDQYLDYANDIHQSGSHLLGLVNDILDLAKVEAGKLEMNPAPTDVAELVEDCLRLSQAQANETGIVISRDIAGYMPPLLVDPRKLRQVVLNLVSNAVKFTEGGGEVSVAVSVDRAGALMIAIRDTGIGMSEDELGQAMQAFGQVDGDLNRKYEGTGLGLPLTRALVELHGGELQIRSEKGAGTTATVRLPGRAIGVAATDAVTAEAEATG